MNFNWLAGLDNKALYFLNDARCHNPVFDAAAVFIANSGDVAVFSAALILLLLRGRAQKVAGLSLLVAMEVSYQLSHGLKALIARPRPSETLADVVTMFSASDFSMPSGHAVMAFSAAFILSKAYGKWPVFYLLATVVAVSRVYAGVHFPSDVLAGAVLGVMTGFVVSKVADKAFSSTI